MSWITVLQICVLMMVGGLVINLTGDSLIKTWQNRDTRK